MGALYKLTFPSGKSYIGITLGRPARRLNLHRSHAAKGRAGAVYNAIRKYGDPASFASVLLVSNDWEYLCLMENRAIAAFGTKAPGGYNLTDGGEGNVGYTANEAARRRHSARAKAAALLEGNLPGMRGNKAAAGYRHTEAALSAIAEAGRGAEFSAERRAKIGASKVGNKYSAGRVYTDEQRLKMSAAQIKRRAAEKLGRP